MTAFEDSPSPAPPPSSPRPGGLRLLVAAGGTGGHVYPALAVVNELRRRRREVEAIFAGTDRGLEATLAEKAGHRVEMIRVEPLRGGSLLRRVRALALLPAALVDAARLLDRVQPSVVMGVGGYLSGPLLLAAWWRRVPTLLLEPNVTPGLTNRWLAPFVDIAAVAWRETADFYGSRALVTGAPVRPEITAVPSREPGPRMTLLLFGGSQGARALNRAMVDALPRLRRAGDRIAIIHQTGEADLEEVRTAYRAAGVEARIDPYLHDMGDAYATCDLVIGRGGAATCAEVAAAGRPAILVPLPLAGGHQRDNAAALRRAGAVVVIPPEELDGPRLAAEILALLEDRGRRSRMIRAACELARPRAAARIAETIEGLVPDPSIS